MTAILDNALGSLKGVVSQRSVRIVPEDATCYLKMQLTVLGCSLSGCSTAIAKGRSFGINEFQVHGCKASFDAAKQSPIVKTAYTDVSSQIAAQCNSDSYGIARIVTQPGAIRLVLSPLP